MSSEQNVDQVRLARTLSRLLFAAREEMEMWADVVESQSGKPAAGTRRHIAEIDAFRAEQGWSPHGFGGESALSNTPEPTDDEVDFPSEVARALHEDERADR